MSTPAQAAIYQCKVDIGPHFLIPRLEPLEVWPDRLIFRRQTPLEIPLSAIENVALKNWWGTPAILLDYQDEMGQAQHLRFVDSNRITPNHARTRALFDLLQRLVHSYRQGAPPRVIVETGGGRADWVQEFVGPTLETRARREVRGWGMAFVFSGAVSLLGSSILSLDPVWGLFLVGVGLVAWRTKELPWLIVVGLFLWWAALNNVVASAGGSVRRWAAAATWQILLGALVLYRYVALRRGLQRPLEDISPVTLGWMPWATLLAGVSCLALFVLGAVGAFLNALGIAIDIRLLEVVMNFVIPLAVLSAAMGLAGLVSFRRKRLISALGLGLGIVGILLILFLASQAS